MAAAKQTRRRKATSSSRKRGSGRRETRWAPLHEPRLMLPSVIHTHKERAVPLAARSRGGRLIRGLLELFVLNRTTARLPLGRSALWLTLVRMIDWRALLLTVGPLLLRAAARRGNDYRIGETERRELPSNRRQGGTYGRGKPQN
jgi:hypothetical protein